MKKRLLVSWIARWYDFRNNLPSHEGPSYDLHVRFFDPQIHAMHLLLNPLKEDEEDTLGKPLYDLLKLNFPKNSIHLTPIYLSDILDFQEIKQKLEGVLRPFAKEYEFDVLISTGTTPMRATWLLLYLEENDLNLHLVQGVHEDMGLGKKHFRRLELDRSLETYRLSVLSQSGQDNQNLYYPPTLTQVYEQARRAAALGNLRCLIYGESGSGKELLARFIHDNSPRKEQPFVSVNCASLTDDLLMARLFGYKRASGAPVQERKSAFEEARGGTLFLDEVSALSPQLQQALVRVIETGEVLPLGDSRSRKTDVRLITSSSHNLWELTQKEVFRSDLFFHLSEAGMKLPAFRDYPLEERRAFIHFMVKRDAARFNRPPIKLEPETERILLIYEFKGNLRQVHNLIRHLYVFGSDSISPADLHSWIGGEEVTDLTLESAKRKHIMNVLELCNGNVSRAAETLGVVINTVKAYVPRPPRKSAAEEPAE